MNRPLEERDLKSDGWYVYHVNNKPIWAWGRFTISTGSEVQYPPILTYNSETKEMRNLWGGFSKKITTLHGMQKMQDISSYLLSEEL